jgi:hypothetical protein
MKKYIVLSVLVLASCLITACNTATPENYFDRAVLNCNMMTGFANSGLQRMLDQPSAKLVAGSKDQTAPMKRTEVITADLEYLTAAFEKVKSLPVTEDSKDILQTSTDLYQYVLPVYKNEYMQLAKLYDEGAAPDKLKAMLQLIEQKYSAGFRTRYDAVMNAGKPYAARHNIPVKWDVKTSADF